ncbi:TIGR00341 family protein [Subtercola sp. PAMC28395]|uniref:TIGR00341 family protein n=1 Tax=Subtercola sp. PAMC28395 TaxID=2846775 RepID=UPI001C0C1476|nr:TIGR00341 family protein [Subtercola sp. PAMC28395]QWT24476.1 TIGR00341 family protein [Subtercola sp. PAMC28395]
MDDRFNTAELMRDSVFFDGPHASRRYSRFWLLLILASVIASAGVVADSTATVIGAMIVAPLMTPIMGTMLATVLGDRANLIRSLLLVVGGAATAVAIGYLVGVLVVPDVLADTNPQVAGRVTPGLIDLLAALGTGVVGSVALVRRDISDTLPGVAIAISLVPPLTVAGLTLESGSVSQFLGALLLFTTNVVAIIGTGIVVMSFYGVNRLTQFDKTAEKRKLGRPIALLLVMLLIIGAPLSLTSASVAARAVVEGAVHSVADEWSRSVGWRITDVSSQGSEIIVRAEGPLPVPGTDELKTLLIAKGISPDLITVNLIPIYTVELDK